VLVGQELHAQDLEMRPLIEHLEEFDQDSIGVFRYTARRCAALYLVVAELTSDSSLAVSERFAGAVPLLLEMATRADQRLGLSEDEAVNATALAVSDIVPLYQKRMRANMAARGSYLADDPFVREDVQVCQSVTGSGGA